LSQKNIARGNLIADDKMPDPALVGLQDVLMKFLAKDASMPSLGVRAFAR
jgi:hypothetical protein